MASVAKFQWVIELFLQSFDPILTVQAMSHPYLLIRFVCVDILHSFFGALFLLFILYSVSKLPTIALRLECILNRIKPIGVQAHFIASKGILFASSFEGHFMISSQ